jgi:hypothetical protein
LVTAITESLSTETEPHADLEPSSPDPSEVAALLETRNLDRWFELEVRAWRIALGLSSDLASTIAPERWESCSEIRRAGAAIGRPGADGPSSCLGRSTLERELRVVDLPVVDMLRVPTDRKGILALPVGSICRSLGGAVEPRIGEGILLAESEEEGV